MTKINYLITDYAPEKEQELEAIKECGTNIIIACEE